MEYAESLSAGEEDVNIPRVQLVGLARPSASIAFYLSREKDTH
jgi:hypothetical protein